MGLEATTLAAIGLGTSTAATAYGVSQNIKQRKAQEQAQKEQKAQNFAAQADEQRQKFREERIRRARIQQSAENTGVSGSSGESGALGSLSTQLGANMGSNLDAVARGGRISNLNQTASNAASNAQLGSQLAQWTPTALKLGDSIFTSNPTSTELQGPLINTIFPNQ